jgi:hypothetical protein
MGAAQNALPGQGLNGGLNADKAATATGAASASGNGAAMGAGSSALEGSPNTTTKSSVGNR